MQNESATVEATTFTLEATCDVCGTDFDPSEVTDTSSTTLCPCCAGDTRRTHGIDILFPRRRR
jgi:hypothetical protein